MDVGALDSPDRGQAPMSDREQLATTARSFFEDLWRHGDYWQLERCELNQASFARQRALLEDRRYQRALELGCGAGLFTTQLAEISDHVTALDVAPSAIEQARARGLDPKAVDFRIANIMDFDYHAEEPWDLIVMSETIYYLGWLYPMYQVCWLGSALFGATTEGGRLLMADTYGARKDYIHLPWLIDTYRDLFLNVGFRREAEEVVGGVKHAVDYEILVTLFSKPAASAGNEGR
jgi:SAM-dependent methyltransferase